MMQCHTTYDDFFDGVHLALDIQFLDDAAPYCVMVCILHWIFKSLMMKRHAAYDDLFDGVLLALMMMQCHTAHDDFLMVCILHWIFNSLMMQRHTAHDGVHLALDIQFLDDAAPYCA